MKMLLAVDIHNPDIKLVFSQAVRFAHQSGGIIDVVYVDGTPYSPGMVQDPAVRQLFENEAILLRRRNTSRLQELVSELPQEVRGQPLHPYGGRPSEVICKLGGQYELIIVATHGRVGFQHFLMGSVAEKIVRHATVPTLVLRIPTE